MKDQIMHSNKPILVFGATGRMGGAVARHLHRDGWCVKAISRSPESEKAKSLIARGIEVMQGDMDEPDTLRQVFKDAYGVFLTVNWFDSGIEGELRQSRNVADLAAASGVQHLVFGAAGIGERGTGLKHFEVKLDIVDDLQSKNVPTTVIYSAPFMELMTDPTLFPQLITWNAKIKVIGKICRYPGSQRRISVRWRRLLSTIQRSSSVGVSNRLGIGKPWTNACKSIRLRQVKSPCGFRCRSG